MRKSFRAEIRASFRSPLPYVIWVVLSIWLSVSGPFGTQEAMILPERALYWSGIVALSIVVGRAARVAAEVALAEQPEPLRRLGPVPVVALALAPVLWAYSQAFPRATPPAMMEFAGFVLLVALGVQLIRWALAQHAVRFGKIGDHQLPLAKEAEAAAPRLVSRLDPVVQGEVLRVSARDHYLDVYTDRGRAELLLRFSDAVAELEQVDGGQVHRSHWVAWAAVAAAEREGSRLFLRLVDGARVPVSRSFQDLVVARFLSPD